MSAHAPIVSAPSGVWCACGLVFNVGTRTENLDAWLAHRDEMHEEGTS